MRGGRRKATEEFRSGCAVDTCRRAQPLDESASAIYLGSQDSFELRRGPATQKLSAFDSGGVYHSMKGAEATANLRKHCPNLFVIADVALEVNDPTVRRFAVGVAKFRWRAAAQHDGGVVATHQMLREQSTKATGPSSDQVGAALADPTREFAMPEIRALHERARPGS